MTLYDFLKLAASAYTTVHGGGKTEDIQFDLPHKSIRSGRLFLLRNGELAVPRVRLATGETFEIDSRILFDGDPYSEIERLYAQFKRSVPNRHEKLNRGCFKALSSDALSMEELTENMLRVQARCELEAFIILASASGLIPWQHPEHFFWQSPTDHDCIIYKEWIL